jgi:hypothetical protein
VPAHGTTRLNKARREDRWQARRRCVACRQALGFGHWGWRSDDGRQATLTQTTAPRGDSSARERTRRSRWSAHGVAGRKATRWARQQRIAGDGCAHTQAGEGDLGEAFPTGGARVDGQQLMAGSRGHRGPLGSEGREGKGERACFRAWAGLVQRIRPRRKELFFLFSKEFPKIQE